MMLTLMANVRQMLTLMAMVMALPIIGEAESPTATGLPKDWGLTMASVMPMLMVMAIARVGSVWAGSAEAAFGTEAGGAAWRVGREA